MKLADQTILHVVGTGWRGWPAAGKVWSALGAGMANAITRAADGAATRESVVILIRLIDPPR
jgi:hypothetical protein